MVFYHLIPTWKYSLTQTQPQIQERIKKFLNSKIRVILSLLAITGKTEKVLDCQK